MARGRINKKISTSSKTRTNAKKQVKSPKKKATRKVSSKKTTKKSSTKKVAKKTNSKKSTAANKVSDINSNARYTAKKYPLGEDGFFGVKGNNKNIREIRSGNQYSTSIGFFNRISRNSKTNTIDGSRTTRSLSDGTYITHRMHTNSEKSPAVQFSNLPSGSIVAKHKVHFVRKKKGK